jgi:hypothetical protein
MAMTLADVQANYQFIDIEGHKSNVVIGVTAPATLADAQTFFDALGDAIDAISDCTMLGYILQYRYLEDAPNPPSPPIGIEAEQALTLRVESVGGFINTITVPGVASDAPYWAIGNEDVANQADALVVSFLDSLIDGNGTVAPTDSQADDLIADGATGAYTVPSAVKYHRPSQVQGGGRRG